MEVIQYKKQLTECPLHRGGVGAGHNFWEIKRGVTSKLTLIGRETLRNSFLCEALFQPPPPPLLHLIIIAQSLRQGTVQEWKIIVCPRYHCSVSSVYNVNQPPHISSKIEILKNFDSCGAVSLLESVASDKVPIKQSRDKRGRK